MWDIIITAVLSIGLLCGISLFMAWACNNVADTHGVLNPPWEEME